MTVTSSLRAAAHRRLFYFGSRVASSHNLAELRVDEARKGVYWNQVKIFFRDSFSTPRRFLEAMDDSSHGDCSREYRARPLESRVYET
jgi:hypothetical protein